MSRSIDPPYLEGLKWLLFQSYDFFKNVSKLVPENKKHKNLDKKSACGPRPRQRKPNAGHSPRSNTLKIDLRNDLRPNLGLHFFLAFQEFVFYNFCSFYQALAKCVIETSKVTRTASTQPTAMQEQKNIAVYDAPGDTFHGNLKELIDLMKNMTEAFGPFLLQNFSLLLLYWLLHLYVLIYFVILTFRNAFIIYDPTLMSMSFLQFGGSILIVR